MSSGRRRTTDRHYSAEEQALDQISKEVILKKRVLHMGVDSIRLKHFIR
jgi:hypothetical protein